MKPVGTPRKIHQIGGVVKFSHPPVHHVHQVLTQFRQPNQAQSSLIKPNQAISCLDAIQSQPPTQSTSSTSVHQIRNPQSAIRNLSQAQSKPVKASQSVSQSLPSGRGSSRRLDILWFPRPNAQPMVVCLCRGHHYRQKSEIRNPKSAIPVDSTQFHLIPLNSTSRPLTPRQGGI